MAGKRERFGCIFGPALFKFSSIFIVGLVLILLNVLTEHLVDSIRAEYNDGTISNKVRPTGTRTLDLDSVREIEYECVSKWITTNQFSNTQYIDEIERKFEVVQEEEVIPSLAYAKADISKTIDKTNWELKSDAKATGSITLKKMDKFPAVADFSGFKLDDVNVTIPTRTKLIVQQRAFDCFNTKDKSLIYHADGKQIAINFTPLDESIVLPVYEGDCLRSLANQLFVTVDRNNRLVANFSYKYATELTDREVFYLTEFPDKTITLKSAHNGLHVCLDDNELLVTCNASIKSQSAVYFSKLCHSHYTGILMGVGDCKVFGLRCVSNGHSVTVNLQPGMDYGVLRANGISWGQEPFPRDSEFYPMTFALSNRFKSEKANRVYYIFGNMDSMPISSAGKRPPVYRHMYLQTTENETKFVSETTFDNFPEFQRIHNADGSFSLKAKKPEQLVSLENCTKFKLRNEEGLQSTCSNKSFPGKEKSIRRRALDFDREYDYDYYDEKQQEDLIIGIQGGSKSTNYFSFFGSPSQLRFYVVKKVLGNEGERGNLYFLLSEDSDLPRGGNHYRPLKITGGQELQKPTAFEKLLEVHNPSLDNRGFIVLNDKVGNNSSRFCDFSIYYTFSDYVFGDDKNTSDYLLFIGIVSDHSYYNPRPNFYSHCEFDHHSAAEPTIDAFPELFTSKQSGGNYLKGITDNGREGTLPLTYDQLATTWAVEVIATSLTGSQCWIILVPEHVGEIDSSGVKEYGEHNTWA